jgi:hypothetical protein
MTKAVVFLLATSALSAGFGVTYWVRSGGPLVDVPQEFDLGVQEAGQLVAVPVVVRNRGRSPLRLDQLKTSCGCLTVRINAESARRDFEEVTVPPGESVELQTGLVARGSPGARLRESLSFRTNDPSQPNVTVSLIAEVQGTILAVPSRLELGRLVVGGVTRRQCLVRDMGRKKPFRLKEARSTIPHIVSVLKVTERGRGEGVSPGLPEAAGRTYALELRVTAPEHRQPIHGQIEIIEEGEASPALTVPVGGLVVAAIEFTPPSIVLPRRSERQLVYTSKSVCLGNDGGPFDLKVVKCPPGVQVRLKRLGEALYHVEVTLLDPQTITRAVLPLTLQATGDSLSRELSLPIRTWTPE